MEGPKKKVKVVFDVIEVEELLELKKVDTKLSLIARKSEADPEA